MEKNYNIYKQKGKGLMKKLGIGLLAAAINYSTFAKDGDITGVNYIKPINSYNSPKIEISFKGERFPTDYKLPKVKLTLKDKTLGQYFINKNLAKKTKKEFIIPQENYAKAFTNDLKNLDLKQFQGLLKRINYEVKGDGGGAGAGGAGGSGSGGGDGGDD